MLLRCSDASLYVRSVLQMFCFVFFFKSSMAATEKDEKVQEARPPSHGCRQRERPSSVAASVASASSSRGA